MQKSLAVLLLAVAARVSVAAPPALPPRAPSPAHDALIKAGYEVLPLICTPGESSNQYVRAKYQGHELILLVDTGASSNAIDTQTARRLKFESKDSGKAVQFINGPRPVHEGLLSGLVIGEAALPPIPFNVTDLSDLKKIARDTDGVDWDCVLSNGVLKYLSAVIDTAGDRLYLLDPVKHAKLAGTWVSAATTAGGAPVAVPPGSVVLVMGGGVLRYSADVGQTFTEYGLLVRCDLSPMWMDWGVGGLRGLFSVEGDTLTLAAPLYPADDIQNRPTKLVCGPGDRFTTVVFKRKPPAK